MKRSGLVVEIIGLGQIGSSLGAALLKHKSAKEVIGFDINSKTAKEALKRKVVHRVVPDKKNLFRQNADVIILAAPVRSIVKLIRKIPENLKQTLIMDVGSAKQEIVAEAKRSGLNFISGHPIAGTEKQGIEACNPDLFAGKPFILIPVNAQDKKMKSLAEWIVKGIGAKPFFLSSAKAHDRIAALLIHLPHILAYTLVHLASESGLPDIGKLGGPSFRDATRVAGSNPQMVTDFLWTNRENLKFLLRELSRHIARLETRFSKSNERMLWSWISKGYERKLDLGVCLQEKGGRPFGQWRRRK